jgi:hypothetical protein
MELKPIEVKHTFPAHKKELICVEEVYVSDHLHEPHYRITHDKNKGISDLCPLIGFMLMDQQAQNSPEKLR